MCCVCDKNDIIIHTRQGRGVDLASVLRVGVARTGVPARLEKLRARSGHCKQPQKVRS